jgi:hypothetical protein
VAPFNVKMEIHERLGHGGAVDQPGAGAIAATEPDREVEMRFRAGDQESATSEAAL